MAQLSPNGKAFTAQMEVWRNRRGEWHVVGADPAFRGTDGLNLRVPKGSKSEATVIKVITDLGGSVPDVENARKRLSELSDEEVLRVARHLDQGVKVNIFRDGAE
jgi:hypothetical protein